MKDQNTVERVLVTGGTGFVAIHCILQLLEKGYQVRTTVRSLPRKHEVLDMLMSVGVEVLDRVEFVETDLSSDKNWDEAVKDCTYVLHVASPIGLKIPKDENEMIMPAVEGVVRVLKAARDGGVKRVVLTSNFGAVGYSHHDKTTLITEEDWTDPKEKGLSAYNKSKVFAERAAWNFMRFEGGALELSVINPVGIFGPAIGKKLSSGFDLLNRVLNGSMKAIPNITLGIVDVRDVADLHIRAMTNAKAKGQRFLAIAGGILSLPEIAGFLKIYLGTDGDRISTKKMPDWAIHLAALFNPIAKSVVPQLGRYRSASNAKAKSVLGWSPRSNEEALLATAESLIAIGALSST